MAESKGKLFGVSVGPGDPELITVKAQRVIAACPVIACVQTKGEHTLALSIAEGTCDMTGKQILELPFTMKRDEATRMDNHKEHAKALSAVLDEGKDIAMLTLGDISVFSTFIYLKDLLEPEYEIEMIPGVTSFCASAARLGTPLTGLNVPLHIVPASGISLDDALGLPGYKVLMKSASQLEEVLVTLNERGLAEKSSLVQNCGLPNEGVYHDINDPAINSSYFTTIIVEA